MMLLSFPLFSSRISLSLSLLYSSSLLFFSFSPLSFHPLKVSVTLAEEERFGERKRDGEKKKKEEKNTDRKRQWVRAPRWVTVKTRRGSDGLICVSRPFPHIVSRAVRWEQGSESWWALFSFSFSFFFVLHNNHQVRQQTHSLPIFSFCPLPDLSNCLASITFFPCPFTSPVSLMWHTHSTVNLFLSVTHTHTLSLSLFEFRPISVNGTCSLCWLAHISFHLNSIWRENCHRRSRYQTSLNNRPVPISLDFLVEGFAEGHRSCRKT